MVRELVFDDLRRIDEDHLHLLGLVLREPAQLRGPRTPRNVVPFAGSPIDTTVYGFLVDGASIETLEAITELAARRILIEKRRHSRVVPNLRAVLSLVALAGADAIGEHDTDAAWLRLHEESMASPEFRNASEALCRLPGVSLPSEPCSLVALPDASLQAPAPRVAGVAGAVALWQAGQRLAATTEIRRQVATMLRVPALVHPSRWSELQAALDTTGLDLDEEDWVKLRWHGVVRAH